MLDYLVKENNLSKEFEEWELNDRDIKFIKELVRGIDFQTLTEEVRI